MTPDTIHFVAQMIRHNRAMATSFEKWVRKQPASPACREMLQVLAVYRGLLTTMESQLVKFDVDTPEEPKPVQVHIQAIDGEGVKRALSGLEEALSRK